MADRPEADKLLLVIQRNQNFGPRRFSLGQHDTGLRCEIGHHGLPGTHDFPGQTLVGGPAYALGGLAVSAMSSMVPDEG